MARRKNSSLVEVAASLKRHRRVPDATTKELLSKVAKLRAEGKNWREVGAALGREHTTVFRTVKRWPVEYERALRKLKRPIDRRAERLLSRLEREDVYRRLELLSLERAAGRVIDAALEDPKISIKLRAAEAYMNYLNQELPERLLSLHSSEPVADDKQSDWKRVAPPQEAAAQPDDDFTDLLARDKWLNELLATLGPDNLTNNDAIMEAALDKCANEPDEEPAGEG
jgi:hypothetical protein